MRDYDAVIIGAGPNGLAAGNVLADAGWHVLVLEAQDRIGGAVASDSDVHDGFTHDTFSSFYPLAAASPVLKAMNLDRFGLTWSHAPAVVGSPDPGGGWALIQHDPRDTAEGLERLHPGDGDAWERMYRDWTHIGDALVDALLSPFPPVRAGLRAATKLRKVGGLSFVRMLLEPSRTLTEHPATRTGGATTDRRERRPRRHPAGRRRDPACSGGCWRCSPRTSGSPSPRAAPGTSPPPSPPVWRLSAGTSAATRRSPGSSWTTAAPSGYDSPTARSSTRPGR